MINMKKSLTAISIAVGLGLSVPVYADGTTGYIQGNAVETSGAKLSNASVSITNLETGLTRSVVTDENGVSVFHYYLQVIIKLLPKRAGTKQPFKKV